MAVLPLVVAPDPRLKEKSAPVETVDDELRAFMDDMLETMYASHGIGLAAIQVGVPKRILTLDIGSPSSRYEDEIDPNSEPNPICMINPEIIERSEEERIFQEGCLSFPGQYADVRRPEKITVKYIDYDGREQILKADGLLATVIQHEMDHLDGVVFVDYLSRMKREMIIRKVKKQHKK